jgi:hypothetical protein
VAVCGTVYLPAKKPENQVLHREPHVLKIVAFKQVILKLLVNLSLEQIIISRAFSWGCPFKFYR